MRVQNRCVKAAQNDLLVASAAERHKGRNAVSAAAEWDKLRISIMPLNSPAREKITMATFARKKEINNNVPKQNAFHAPLATHLNRLFNVKSESGLLSAAGEVIGADLGTTVRGGITVDGEVDCACVLGSMHFPSGRYKSLVLLWVERIMPRICLPGEININQRSFDKQTGFILECHRLQREGAGVGESRTSFHQ